jgi:hypothetical protein
MIVSVMFLREGKEGKPLLARQRGYVDIPFPQIGELQV